MVLNRNDRRIDSAHISVFLTKWDILSEDKRKTFLELHEARAAKIIQVCIVFLLYLRLLNNRSTRKHANSGTMTRERRVLTKFASYGALEGRGRVSWGLPSRAN